ncbi:hypothetical protein KGQ64_02710 [bacterium]|nr:hypothetical protein [bacterium]
MGPPGPFPTSAGAAPGAVLAIQVASTLFMAGVIAVVQVVHYPLFARVGAAAFAAYEIEHRTRISLVVMLPMLVELATAAWIALQPPPSVPPWSAWLGLALLAVVWLSTFFLQVPLHDRLSRGFDPAAIDALVRGNAIRTVAWMLRAALATWWTARLAG